MKTKNRPKLMVIDGHALIHRSFHALPTSLTTKDGVIVNAVYGFTSFLLKAFAEFKPEYVALTLDQKGPTFRHEEYKEYKGTRSAAPDELHQQIPIVKEVAEALDIPIFEMAGYEADDLIGTITRRAELETEFESYIVTGDMDSLQLVTPRTKVYTMSRGLSDSVTYDEDKVEERYGLKPKQVIDYKALRGDPSDNIPGVKGIGEKTATELLQEFKNLEGVYTAAEKNSPKIKPRIIELLKTYKDEAYLSQNLATIKRDVELDLNWEDLRLSSFDLDKAIELFIKLEFRSLIDKLRAVKNFEEKVVPETAVVIDKFDRNKKNKKFILINTDVKFDDFLKKIKKVKAFAIDTETGDFNQISAELLGLSFSWEKDTAYFLDLSQPKDHKADLFNYQNSNDTSHAWLNELKYILEDEEIKKYAHNAKFDLHLLKNRGIELKGLSFDTMLASYLLNPDNRQHDLDAVSFRELGWEKISIDDLVGKGKTKTSFSEIESEKIALYSSEDANCTWLLKDILEKKIKSEKLDKLMTEVDLPLIPVLADMEENGIILDTAKLKKIEKDLEGRLKELEKKIYKQAGEEFNINSPKQLQVILFEKLGITTKKIKKTKTGISTADDELQKLLEEHEIIALIQKYRELNKLQTTYVTALPTLVNGETGRIHTNYNQTIAATGRLSSTDPNLQNIPTRTEEGQKIRSAFIARKGWKLVSLDYSQIELRLAAHLSGDKKMIKAFQDNEDIHRATAAEINEVELSEVTKKMRSEAKATNFGILYGQGPHGLSQNAGIPYAKAQEFIAKYFSAYPGVRKMVDNSIEKAREKGYAIDIFGRRRYLPELNSPTIVIRHTAERMAINTPIQGAAADLLKIAMINIFKRIKNKSEEIRMLLQIHDELIFEIKEDKINAWLPEIKKIMENVIELKVPIIVESATGDDWGQLK